MHKGLILVKNRNFLIPQEIITKATDRFKSGYALAVANPEDEVIEVQQEARALTADELATMQDGLKDETTVFFLQSFDGELHADDLQPFTLVRKPDDGPVFVAFMEGDFSGFAQPSSVHSPAFFAAHQDLIPRFENLISLCDGDFEKFLGTLQAPIHRRDIEKLTTRGGIVLLAATGELQTFGVGISKQDWGIVSGLESGYPAEEEKPKEEEKKEEPKTTSKLSKLAALKEKAKEEKAAEESKKEEKGEGKPIIEGRKEAEAIDKEIPKGLFYPPKGITNQQKKSWYENVAGARPQNWKDNPGVELKDHKGWLYAQKHGYTGPVIPEASGGYKPFQALEALKSSTAPAPSVNADKTTLGLKFQKDTSTKHIGQAESEQNPSVTDEVLPIIPPKELKDLEESGIVRRILDSASKPISDPTELQKVEKFVAIPATEQMGLPSLDPLHRMSYKDMIILARQYPNTAGGLIFQLLLDRERLMKDLDKLTAPATKTETKTEEPKSIPGTKLSKLAALKRTA